MPHVDLARVVGDWYAIGVIPTVFEWDAYNEVESYSINPDGTMATTFTFRRGDFDGPSKKYHPTGFVTSNAVWGVQLVWPIKAEYLIVHLGDSHTIKVVAWNKRDHAWIMSRTSTLPGFGCLDLFVGHSRGRSAI